MIPSSQFTTKYELLSSLAKWARSIIQNAISNYHEKSGSQAKFLVAGRMENDELISKIQLLLDWDNVRLSVLEKLEFSNLKKCYVSQKPSSKNINFGKITTSYEALASQPFIGSYQATTETRITPLSKNAKPAIHKDYQHTGCHFLSLKTELATRRDRQKSKLE